MSALSDCIEAADVPERTREQAREELAALRGEGERVSPCQHVWKPTLDGGDYACALCGTFRSRGVSEPPNTEARLAAVREALPRECKCPDGMRYHALNCDYRPGALNERAALDAIASELRQRASMENGYKIRAHAAEAELERVWGAANEWRKRYLDAVAGIERVRAERDEARGEFDVDSVTLERLQARLRQLERERNGLQTELAACRMGRGEAEAELERVRAERDAERSLERPRQRLRC